MSLGGRHGRAAHATESDKAPIARRAQFSRLARLAPFAPLVLVVAFLAPSAARADVQVRYPLGGYYHVGRYMPAHLIADVPEVASLPEARLYLSARGAMQTELLLAGGKADAVVPWLMMDRRPRGAVAGLMVMARGFSRPPRDDPRRQELKELGPDERLVAFAAGDADEAKAAATRAWADPPPDPRIESRAEPRPEARGEAAAWVPIELDRSHPLAGPPAAWEGLDAVVLDPAALLSGQIDEQKLGVLVAAGTRVLVRDDAPAGPDAATGTTAGVADKPPFFPHWPWRRLAVPAERGGSANGGAGVGGESNHYWLLHQTPAGPAVPTYGDEVFKPILGKSLAWPEPFRRRVFLYGVLFAIAALAVALWRPRFTAGVALLLSAGTLSLLAAWWRMQTPLVGMGGPILVELGPAPSSPAQPLPNQAPPHPGDPDRNRPGGRLLQTDAWSFQATATSAASTVRWNDLTKPYFPSPDELDASDIVLRCGPSGDPHEFFLRLRANGHVALLTRATGPGALSRSPRLPAESELMPLVKSYYLRPGDELLGQIPWTPPLGTAWQQLTAWPAVVVRKGANAE